MTVERQINPRIIEAVEEYRRSLESLGKVQDPLLVKILRNESLEKLQIAVDIAVAVELQENIKTRPFSKN